MVMPGVYLRPDEEELLIRLVKADNAVTPRQTFISSEVDQNDHAIVNHDGLGTGNHELPGSCIVALEREGLIAFRRKSKTYQGQFEVTGKGYAYYDALPAERK